MAKTPSADFTATTPKNSLLSQ